MSGKSDLQRSYKGIPRAVWALGFVSLFMDISSEMIHALLPLFLVTVLGLSALAVGLIEGSAEATRRSQGVLRRIVATGSATARG